MKNLKLICLVLVGVLFLSGCGCSKTKEYTVTFNSNGGSSVSSVVVEENKLVTKPADPTYEGYTFDGWYDGDVKFDFNTKITKDITLKAKWTQNAIDTDDKKNNETDETKTYTVTFNSDGGSKVTAKTVNENGKVAKPTNPTKSGYKFLGWYLDNKAYNFDTKVTKDITLTAKWEKTETKTQDTKVAVTSVSLSSTSLSLTVGETSTLTATVKPDNATNKTVTWSSSNTAVATVDKNGKVTAVKVGSAEITATADGKSSKATITVTKKAETDTKVAVTNVKLSSTSLTLDVGATSTLTATVEPSNATNKTVTWSSSDATIAKVDANGKVTAVKAGTAEITATADGKTAKATVTVLGYYVEIKDVANSMPQQAMYYIKDTAGNYHNGTIKVTYKAGDTETFEITNSGKIFYKATITKVEVEKINK